MLGRVRPDFARFAEGARSATLVPLCLERLGDLTTPVAVALQLSAHVRRPFLLESADGAEHIGRYSYLGGDPFLEIVGDADGLRVLRPDGDAQAVAGPPIEALRDLLGAYRSVPTEEAPPFAGGAVGYIGYEAARWVERLPAGTEPSTPWLSLGLYDTLVAFDHLHRRVRLVANVHVGDAHDRVALRRAYDDALERLERLDAILAEPVPSAPFDLGPIDDASQLPTTTSLDATEFARAVGRAQSHIVDGDAFQVVVSRRLDAPVSADPMTVYRALRAINPSPYMYCLETPEAAIVGSSPEMLVRVEKGFVETRPIAGTRRRGADPAADDALERELLGDAKECAEHLMLVDLGRNDVGRVAVPGGVEVPEFMTVERYSHVMHIVSSVRGRLRDDVSPIEALFASFPAGTVSGAPKIRAMEILDELEPCARGPYAGAVLYCDFAGNLNSCITIRTITMADGVASVQAGAGIVADSRAEREFEETGEKAAACLQALAWAQAATQRRGQP